MNMSFICRIYLQYSLFALLGVLIAQVPCEHASAQDASEAKAASRVVLVPPFENNSNKHPKIPYDVLPRTAGEPKRTIMIDRLTEAPRSILENTLGNFNDVTVVERKRIDSMLVETEFGALSGLVDSDKAVKLGKLVGANLIVMGTINDIREETKKFKGYGVQTESTDVICSMNVRLVDIASGVQVFTKEFKGTKNYTKSSFGSTESSDRSFAAIEETLKLVSNDEKFKLAIAGKKVAPNGVPGGMVEIEFAPKPDNCDIEIDGNYVGGSPLKRMLPVGKKVKVRISKDGHKEWEGMIVPEAGLKITRELGVN